MPTQQNYDPRSGSAGNNYTSSRKSSGGFGSGSGGFGSSGGGFGGGGFGSQGSMGSGANAGQGFGNIDQSHAGTFGTGGLLGMGFNTETYQTGVNQAGQPQFAVGTQNQSTRQGMRWDPPISGNPEWGIPDKPGQWVPDGTATVTNSVSNGGRGTPGGSSGQIGFGGQSLPTYGGSSGFNFPQNNAGTSQFPNYQPIGYQGPTAGGSQGSGASPFAGGGTPGVYDPYADTNSAQYAAVMTSGPSQEWETANGAGSQAGGMGNAYAGGNTPWWAAGTGAENGTFGTDGIWRANPGQTPQAQPSSSGYSLYPTAGGIDGPGQPYGQGSGPARNPMTSFSVLDPSSPPASGGQPQTPLAGGSPQGGTYQSPGMPQGGGVQEFLSGFGYGGQPQQGSSQQTQQNSAGTYYPSNPSTYMPGQSPAQQNPYSNPGGYSLPGQPQQGPGGDIGPNPNSSIPRGGSKSPPGPLGNPFGTPGQTYPGAIPTIGSTPRQTINPFETYEDSELGLPGDFSNSRENPEYRPPPSTGGGQPQPFTPVGAVTPNGPWGSVDSLGNRIFNCFVAGTPIATPSGEKRIEDIQIGDTVVTFDHDTDSEVLAAVSNTIVSDAEELFRIDVGDVSLQVTGEHPFWVEGLQDYVPVRDLSVGDVVKLLGGDSGTVRDIQQFQSSQPVYNITVDGQHNYFAAGVLVHNKSVTQGFTPRWTGPNGGPPITSQGGGQQQGGGWIATQGVDPFVDRTLTGGGQQPYPNGVGSGLVGGDAGWPAGMPRPIRGLPGNTMDQPHIQQWIRENPLQYQGPMMDGNPNLGNGQYGGGGERTGPPPGWDVGQLLGPPTQVGGANPWWDSYNQNAWKQYDEGTGQYSDNPSQSGGIRAIDPDGSDPYAAGGRNYLPPTQDPGGWGIPKGSGSGSPSGPLGNPFGSYNPPAPPEGMMYSNGGTPVPSGQTQQQNPWGQGDHAMAPGKDAFLSQNPGYLLNAQGQVDPYKLQQLNQKFGQQGAVYNPAYQAYA
jgi:hypothetical protein